MELPIPELANPTQVIASCVVNRSSAGMENYCTIPGGGSIAHCASAWIATRTSRVARNAICQWPELSKQLQLTQPTPGLPRGTQGFAPPALNISQSAWRVDDLSGENILKLMEVEREIPMDLTAKLATAIVRPVMCAVLPSPSSIGSFRMVACLVDAAMPRQSMLLQRPWHSMRK